MSNKLQQLKQATDYVYKLEQDMWHELAAILPDFYWSNSKNVYMNLDERVLDFPCAKKMQPDMELTPARRSKLRELGFIKVYSHEAEGRYLRLDVCGNIGDEGFNDDIANADSCQE